MKVGDHRITHAEGVAGRDAQRRRASHRFVTMRARLSCESGEHIRETGTLRHLDVVGAVTRPLAETSQIPVAVRRPSPDDAAVCSGAAAAAAFFAAISSSHHAETLAHAKPVDGLEYTCRCGSHGHDRVAGRRGGSDGVKLVGGDGEALGVHLMIRERLGGYGFECPGTHVQSHARALDAIRLQRRQQTRREVEACRGRGDAALLGL